MISGQLEWTKCKTIRYTSLSKHEAKQYTDQRVLPRPPPLEQSRLKSDELPLILHNLGRQDLFPRLGDLLGDRLERW